VHQTGVIVITGCSSGIGRHAAIELATRGYHVFASVRKDKDKQSLLEEAKNLKGSVVPVLFDVTNSTQIEQAVKEVTAFLEKKKLPFVGLVNNAGVGGRGPVETLDMPSARKMFDTNYWGSFETTQQFLPLLRSSKGRVVFISSVAGVVSIYGSGAYSATKHAMEIFADSLRLEMVPFGVSVSVVEPGYIKTNITQNAYLPPKQTPEQEKAYHRFWDAVNNERKENFDSYGAEPTVTTDVIIHALLNKNPHTRYPVGPADGIYTARMVVFLTSTFPDRLADILKNKRAA